MDPIKLQKIDESLLSEYSCLDDSDHCYFIGEYAARQGFDHINPYHPIQNMNQVINNFKKPMERKEKNEWYFKEQAILKIAYWLISTTCWDKIKTATWVPMPPSKAKSDSMYDDRLLRVLLKMKETEASLDIRELIFSKSSRQAAHEPGATRPKVSDHKKNFEIDESKIKPRPNAIILFDDIITSGAHFTAAQNLLRNEFPTIPIIGIFVARSVRIEDAT